MEISRHILRKSIVGPVSHSLIIKLELLLVPKAECFLSLTKKKKKSVFLVKWHYEVKYISSMEL